MEKEKYTIKLETTYNKRFQKEDLSLTEREFAALVTVILDFLDNLDNIETKK